MATKKYIEIVVSSKGAEKNVNSLDRSMTGLGKSTDKSTTAMNSLSKAATAVAAALSVRQVIAYADAWTVVNNKLANSVRATEELADVTNRVFGIAQDSRASLAATATLYQRLERATREYNISAEDLVTLTSTINKAFVVSGATAQEAEGAIVQLSQGIASGVLRGQEYNSVAEQGSRLSLALADSLGVGIGKLRTLANQGKLTSDVLIKSFLSQSDVIKNEFSNTIATFGQKTEIATNNLTKFIGESTLVKSSVSVFGDAMLSASENIQTLIDVGTPLAILYGSRVAAGIVLSTQATIAKTAATVAEALATSKQSAATVVALESEVAMLAVKKQAIAAEIQSAGGVRVSIAERGRLTAATVALTSAEAKLATAHNAVAASATRLSIAAGFLRNGLALLGGPVGILLITVASLAAYYDAAEDAEERTLRLSGEVDGLTDSYKKLNSVQRQIAIAKISTEMSELRAQLILANTALNNWTETAKTDPFANQQVKRYKGEVEALNEQLDGLSVKQQAIFASGIPTLTGTTPEDSGGGPKIEDTRSARALAAERETTEALRNELGNRALIFDLYTQEINALEDGSFAQQRLIAQAESAAETLEAQESLRRTKVKLENELALVLENDKLSAEARNALKVELQEQELLAEQEYQLRLNEIAEDGKDARNSITRAEWETAAAVVGDLGSNILSAFQGQSRKMFEIGKALAISDTIISTYSSATKAYDSLASIPIVGPALGAAAAAAAIAGGLANVNRIKSTSFGSNGGGSSSTYGGGQSASGASTAQAPSAPTQTTVFDFRARPGQAFTADDVLEILGSIDGATVINNGQEEARRLGEIA